MEAYYLKTLLKIGEIVECICYKRKGVMLEVKILSGAREGEVIKWVILN